YLQSKNSPWTF
nr:immunoglobulin light chain junction region [Macaca mulatta]